MIKSNKLKLIITSLVILLPILFGLIVWNKLPEQMVTHWGANGIANGWESREVAVFALPLFILFAHWICILSTSKSPKNKNQSDKTFGIVLWICPVTSLLANGMIYTTALGKEISPYFITLLLLGFLFTIIGIYLPKRK